MPIPRHRDLIVVTTPDPNLLAAAFLCGYRQATQRLQPLVAEARRDALTDPLTGLRNRRAAQLHLNAAALGGAYLWVALVDARDLKTLNDTYGHSTGDRMLQAVSSALKAVAAPLPGAVAFRYGGDEFVLTAHDVGDPWLPEQIAGLIHARLAGDGAAHPDRHQPRVSIGWASTRQEIPAGDVLEAAGIALAAAKHTGPPRDGSTVHSVRYRAGPPTGRTHADARIPAQRGPAAGAVGRAVWSQR